MKRLSIALLLLLPLFPGCGDDEATTQPISAWIVSPASLDVAFGDMSIEVVFSGPVAQVELLVNGEMVATQETTTESESIIFTWSSTAHADGTTTLSARATAGDGRSADSDGVDVIIDNTAPTATIDMARRNVVDGSISIPVTVSDANPGSVKLLDRNGTLCELSGTVASFDLDTTTMNDGVHWLSVEATDLAGHTATSFEIPVIVANNGEEVEVEYIPEAMYEVPANYSMVEHHVRTMVPTEEGITRIVAWLTWEGGSDWNMEFSVGEGFCPHRGIRFVAVESTSGEIIIDLPRSELSDEVELRLPADERDSDTFPVNNDPATFGAFFTHTGVMNPQDHVNESLPIDVHFVLFH